MIVDVDLGNTRIKWRSSEQPEAVASFQLEEDLPRAWCALSACDRVRVASVLSPEKTAAFRDAVQQCSPAVIQIARVQQGFAGLQLAYADPSGFGVDRWLALLAARARFPGRDCVVVSGGTALTVDWVTAQGRHLGGYIAPGWRTAARALWQNTDRLDAARLDFAPRFQPGATTLECIAAGTTLLFEGFASRLRQAVAAELSAPQWVFTGGDAATLLAFFDKAAGGFFVDSAGGSLGNAEGSLRNAEGSFGSAEGSLGNAEGSLGSSEGSLGNAEGSLANAEGSSGNAEGSSANAGGPSGGAGGPAAHETAQLLPRLVLDGLAIALP